MGGAGAVGLSVPEVDVELVVVDSSHYVFCLGNHAPPLSIVIFGNRRYSGRLTFVCVAYATEYRFSGIQQQSLNNCSCVWASGTSAHHVMSSAALFEGGTVLGFGGG